MTDEKKKPEEDEVTEEQLEDVAGGATAGTVLPDISLTKQADKASVPLADFVSEGSFSDPVVLEVRTAGDEDD